MKKLLLAGLLAMVALAPTFAGAQTQAEEKMLVGEVQSIDQTGTQITLKDGTTLLTCRVDASTWRSNRACSSSPCTGNKRTATRS